MTGGGRGDIEEFSAEDLRLLIDQLVAAVDSRDVIGMAKGILMATGAITADAAFDLLRAASQRENRKLRDVAADVVARHNALAVDTGLASGTPGDHPCSAG